MSLAICAWKQALCYYIRSLWASENSDVTDSYMGKAEWDPVASYHDILFKGRVLDIPFWIALAKQFGSPILELTSGTGRLTLPVARAGIRITGLDISTSMLRIAEEKKRKLNKSVRQNAHFVFGDATNFSLIPKKFQAVFLPWGFVPVTSEEQGGLFHSVRRALIPSGHIVVDIENAKNPREDWDIVRLKERIPLHRQGATLIRTAYNSGIAATRIGRIVYTLDIVKKNGAMRRLVTERVYKIYTIQELKRLLVTHGFRIERVYGDYDFSPWTKDSPRAIVVGKQSTVGFLSTIGNFLSQYG